MQRKNTRRSFLGQTTAAGFGFWVAGRSTPAFGKSANEKLNIACIGVGGRGAGNVHGVRGENLVAFCDVDERHAGQTYEQYPNVPRFADYRKLFDKLHKEIDAVVVSTPDHMHAPITLAAMELGKHVYCEKPLTRTVAEARRVAQAAARYKVVTQMGNGGNAQAGSRRTVELLRARAIGEVTRIHAWTDRPSVYWKNALDRPADAPDIPKTLQWDLWLGVAPRRPYHSAYLPAAWRGWYDFGTGALGDMACHICNVAFWGLHLHGPRVIEAETSERHKESFPAWSRIRWEFPRDGERGPVDLFWYDGGQRPPASLVGGRELIGNGMIIVGTHGTIYLPSADGTKPTLLPEEDFANFTPPPKTLPDSPGHHEEWIIACKENKPGLDHMSNFTRAAVMTESLLLGNLAVRSGKRIEWNPAKMECSNVSEANAWVDEPYRTGW